MPGMQCKHRVLLDSNDGVGVSRWWHAYKRDVGQMQGALICLCFSGGFLSAHCLLLAASALCKTLMMVQHAGSTPADGRGRPHVHTPGMNNMNACCSCIHITRKCVGVM
jgi:hypothetical protein